MSAVENNSVADAPTLVAQHPDTTVVSADGVPHTDPVLGAAAAAAPETKPEETTADSQIQSEAAAAAATTEAPKAEAAAVPVVEPITEGLLNYKGPGLLKSLIPSKKDFWLSDEPVSQHALGSYMRGEKPEVSHPVVAWASQTGKGLLFFNKKGDTNRTHPGHVLALYEAADLRKRNPQEISFSIKGQEHVLKASTDTERDAWFMSIEKSAELGKAAKTEVEESEGYKEELEKLNKPHVAATAAAVASKRGQSQPKKSSEVERHASEDEAKKDKKARSTSRGMLNRLKGKKEEAEAKKEEKEADKENAKPDNEHKTEEEVVAGAAVAGTGAAVVGTGAAAVEHSEDKKDFTESPAEAAKTEEKTKQGKRGSIFGKMAGWGAMKSPTKEKDAELKPEPIAAAPVAATEVSKDGVAEEAPVLPETATTERTDPEAEADKIETKAEEEVAKENAVEEPKKEEVATPAKEKSSFLSGLLPKRGRSVSPSPALTKSEPEAAKEAAQEPVKAEEPTVEAAAATATAEKTEEPVKTETSTANKRQSMLGSIGRRASKAMSGMRGAKKENAAPATAEETTTDAAPAATTTAAEEEKTASAIDGEVNGVPTIGDAVPAAIQTEQQAPVVTASA